MAAKVDVFGFVDHTHAPAADLVEYAVMGNRPPHGLGGRDQTAEMLGVTLKKVNRGCQMLRSSLADSAPRPSRRSDD